MNQTEQLSPLAEPDLRTTQQLVERARRDGITRFQVVALVHPGDADDYVLLLDHQGDDVWALPVAEVRPTENVALTLDWLCNEHLGLRSWSAEFATSAGYTTPDGDEVLQLAFDVPVPEGNRMTWKGACQWWHVGAEPSSLHRLARPMFDKFEQLQHVQQVAQLRSAE
ncbi:hypothetical protein ABH940_001466 [Streptacidiphilus sp. BW17]|uniref:hypothetical protein n=1 Tax=Streptacidiphilus sp. BW17 TaxID=3156274 RepID=UPI003516451F